VSKPSASKKFMPAGWFSSSLVARSIVVCSIIALVAVAAIGIAGSASLRSHRASASAQPVAAAAKQAPALNARGRVQASMATLPLAFEANQGQTDPQVKYMARGNGYTVFLTANDTVFAMSQASPSRLSGRHGLSAASHPVATAKQVPAAIHMKPVGGNSHPQIAAGRELPGRTNYFIGSDPSKWQQGVKQYATVSYRDVYPGVDMAFHGQQRQLEFDFVVAPGANPGRIAMGFTGAKKLSVDAAGDLLLASATDDVVLHKPVAYQEKDGKRELVEAAFDVKSNREAAFSLGTYDHQRELVIDPSLSYATYVGGASEDEAFAIALDGSGNAYVTGQTNSLAFNGKPAGPNFNVFVTKVNSTGTGFGYTDIFEATGGGTNCSAAGTGNCSGNAIAVDGSGNAYVAGSATAGFPTLSAFQSGFGGGTSDAFALKLNSSGTLVYSTYLGGSGNDDANAIAVDGSGNVYVAGETHSTNFPLSPSAIQSTESGDDAFVTKINSSGTTLAYSTYLGGSSTNLATGIALDSSNNAYVTGITDSSDFPTTSGVVQATAGGADDGFVTEVKADGSAWVYSTYLGGSGTDDALGIAVDSAGEAYVTGSTNSTNFPTANPAQSALGGSSATNVFVTKLNAGGTELVFSTYYGGNLDDAGAGIALDSFGDAYVTGTATSSNYPVTSGGGTLSGASDALVTEFSNTGFVVYSTFLGGSGTENQEVEEGITTGPFGAIAVDSSSNAYLAGMTASTDFPASAGAAQATYGGGLNDGFVAKVGAAPADFSVAVSPTSASVTPGQSASAITITVSSVNASYGQAVALSCTGLPTGAGCNFTSGSLTPTATAVTTSLTITTTGATTAMYGSSKIFYAMWLPVVGLSLIGMRFSSTGSRQKRLLGFLLLGLVMTSLFLLPACGSSSGGGGGGCTGCTPAGSYTVTVSGAGGGATHTAPFKLTVN
jgi:hypothetical protein